MSKDTEKAAWGGAFDAFGKMWERVKANPQPAIVAVAAYLALTLIQISMYGYEEVKNGQRFDTFGFEVFFFLFFLLALPTYTLALAKGKPISVHEFLHFNGKKYFALLGASILAGLAAIGSILLFIVPAIWVIVWFALFQFAVVDKNLGPIQALKESKRLTKDHKGKVWGIIGATILFVFGASLLTIIPIIGFGVSIVASSVISILSAAALASLYRWLKAQ